MTQRILLGSLLLLASASLAHAQDVTNVVVTAGSARGIAVGASTNTNTVALRLQITTDTGAIDLEGITVYPVGAESNVVTSGVRVWYDSSATFNAGSATPLDVPRSFPGGGNPVTFTFTQALTPSSSANYIYVTLDIASKTTATDGAFVGAGIDFGGLAISDDLPETWPKHRFRHFTRELIFADFFVNPGGGTDRLCTVAGNDSSDGLTPDTPKLTLHGASGLLNSVDVNGGHFVYIDAGTSDIGTGLIDISSDDQGFPTTTFATYRGALDPVSRAWLTELTSGAAAPGSGAIIRVNDLPSEGGYVRIRDLEISFAKNGTGAAANTGNGIRVIDADHVEVINCHLHDNEQGGVAFFDVTGPSYNGDNLVKDCLIENNTGTGGVPGHGVIFFGSPDSRVEGCIIRGHTRDGIQLVRSSSDVEIDRNQIYGNRTGISVIGFEDGTTAGDSSDNAVITNNVIHTHTSTVGGDFEGFGIRILGDQDGATIRHNVLYNNTTGIQYGHPLLTRYSEERSQNNTITHNTIYANIGGFAQCAGIRIQGTSTGSTIERNIIVASGNNQTECFDWQESSTASTDYNNLWVEGGPTANGRIGLRNSTNHNTLGSWQGSGGSPDPNSQSTNPLFVDFDGADGTLGGTSGTADDDDFHLQGTGGQFAIPTGKPLGQVQFPIFVEGPSNSPSIDFGNGTPTGETAPDGGSPNLGAYGDTPEASRDGNSNNAPQLKSNAPEPDGLAPHTVSRRRGLRRIVISFSDADASSANTFDLWLSVRSPSGRVYVLLDGQSHGQVGKNGAGALTVDQNEWLTSEYQAWVYWDPPDDIETGSYDLECAVADSDGATNADDSLGDAHAFDDVAENSNELQVVQAPIPGAPANAARFNTGTPSLGFNDTEPNANNTNEFAVDVLNNSFGSVESAASNASDPGFNPDESASPYAARYPVEYTVQSSLSNGVYHWEIDALGGGSASARRSFTVGGSTAPAGLADYFQNVNNQFNLNAREGLAVSGGSIGLSGSGTGMFMTELLNVSGLHLGRFTSRMTHWDHFEINGSGGAGAGDQVALQLWRHPRNNAGVDVMVANATLNGAGGSFQLTLDDGTDWTAGTVNDTDLYFLKVDLRSTNSGFDVDDVLGQGDTVNALTAVTLSSLTATPYDGEVLVEWRTTEELSNLGFNVYRSEHPDRDFALISDPGGLIVGLGDDITGGAYYLLDQTAVNGVTYYYKLQDVESGGRTTLHGPVEATPQAGLGAAVLNPPYINFQVNDGSPGWGSGVAADPDGSQSGDYLPIGPGIQLAQNDASGFDIVIDVLRFTRTSGAFDAVAIDGYTDSTDAARPVVPTRTFLFEVPAVLSASLSGLTTVTETHAGYTLAAPGGGAPSPSATPWPPAALEIAGILEQGDRTYLSLRVNPVAFTVDTGSLDYHSKIMARVDYGPPQPAQDPTQASESIQALLAVNPGALKISVSQDGVYRVGQADLAAAGFDTTADPRRLWLYNLGEPIPLRVIGESDGSLDPGDAVEFYGQRNTTTFTDSPQTRYGDTNVYWLVSGGLEGPRIPEVAAAAGTTPHPCVTTTARARHEQQTYIRRTAYLDEGRDHWFSERLIGVGSGNETGSYGLDVWSPDANPEAVLRYRLRGGSSGIVPDPDHAVRIDFNGATVDTASFDGEALFTGEVPVSGVLFGTNTVDVTLLNDATSRVYVDWVELRYTQRLISQDRASLRFGDGSATVHRLENFADPNVTVWDVSDPRAPTLLLAAPATDTGVVQGAGGALTAGVSYQVTVDSNGATARPLEDALAVTPAGRLTPDALTLHVPQDELRDTNQGADYLVITDASLLSAAIRLADHRANQGLRTSIVTVDGIMDAFAHGNYDPNAITEFVRYAYERWQLPRPKYLCLLGDGHYDYHDHLGTAAPQLVPALMVETDSLWAASDNRYATVAGSDLVPDLLVGRLPVKTLIEADRAVDKIIAYETAAYDPSWAARSLFVGDDADIIDYQASLDELMGRLPPSHGKVRAYYPLDGDAPTIRQQITDEVNAGVLLTVFSGHGSTTQWGDDLFNTTRYLVPGPGIENDLDGLTNADRQTIGLVFNCHSGDFAFNDPNLTIMGEGWVNLDGAGAVAFWASTGQTSPDGQHLLGTHLFDVLFVEEREGVLGDALAEAKLRLAADGSYDDVLDTWSLLGDPALSVQAENRRFAEPNPLPLPPRRARFSLFGCNLLPAAEPALSALPCLLLLLLLCWKRFLPAAHRGT